MIGVIFKTKVDISTFKGESFFTVVGQDEKSGLYHCKPDIVGYQKGKKGSYIPSTLCFTGNEVKKIINMNENA